MNVEHLEWQQMRAAAHRAAALMKALSHESRLMILCHLAEGEKSVGTLEDLVGLSQSALSQHLARLRRDGLVATRRQAQTIYYRLNGEEAVRVIGLLYELYCGGAKTDTAEEKNP